MKNREIYWIKWQNEGVLACQSMLLMQSVQWFWYRRYEYSKWNLLFWQKKMIFFFLLFVCFLPIFLPHSVFYLLFSFLYVLRKGTESFSFHHIFICYLVLLLQTGCFQIRFNFWFSLLQIAWNRLQAITKKPRDWPSYMQVPICSHLWNGTSKRFDFSLLSNLKLFNIKKSKHLVCIDYWHFDFNDVLLSFTSITITKKMMMMLVVMMLLITTFPLDTYVGVVCNFILLCNKINIWKYWRYSDRGIRRNGKIKEIQSLPFFLLIGEKNREKLEIPL